MSHDIVFANSILRDISLLKEKDKEIDTIVLELGELVGIEAGHLIEGLNAASGGGKYKFVVIPKKSLIKCPCGFEGQAEIIERLHDAVIWKCPWCDDPIETMEVIEGDKIKILKILYK